MVAAYYFAKARQLAENGSRQLAKKVGDDFDEGRMEPVGREQPLRRIEQFGSRPRLPLDPGWRAPASLQTV